MSSPRRSPKYCDRTGKSEQLLWQAVLLQLVHDLCAQKNIHKERKDAERWVGPFPDRNFRMVCSLAGFDYEAVWDRLKVIADRPHQDRDWPKPGQATIPADRAADRPKLRRSA